MKEEPIKELAIELGVALPTDNDEKNRLFLAETINELLQTGFDTLVSILYRMDVSEEKLKAVIQENPGKDAGLLIADLMIERQLEKIKSRQQNRQRDNDINEEDKW